MLKKDVIERAKMLGIPRKYYLKRKRVIIHQIQEMENHEPCFGTKEACDNKNCMWVDDCRKDYKRWYIKSGKTCIFF